jgi:hypothetical protein
VHCVAHAGDKANNNDSEIKKLKTSVIITAGKSYLAKTESMTDGSRDCMIKWCR